jgi:hypothetical protein
MKLKIYTVYATIPLRMMVTSPDENEAHEDAYDFIEQKLATGKLEDIIDGQIEIGTIEEVVRDGR